MAAQSVESVPGMWPEGAPEMHSVRGKDYDYVVEHEGLYVFQCPPHWRARMGGIMVVGNPQDLAAIVTRYEALATSDKAAKPATGLLKKFRERTGLLER